MEKESANIAVQHTDFEKLAISMSEAEMAAGNEDSLVWTTSTLLEAAAAATKEK